MAARSALTRPLALHRALADESRLRILALLRERARPLDVNEIASAVALHPNTVREHLNVLLNAQLARTHPEKRDRAGRPRALYQADGRGDRWFLPLEFERLSEEESLARSRAFLELMLERRSVREFAPDPVPLELVENAVRTAATAPSGANRQPWRFVVVSDAAVKAEIRSAAEHEEQLFYAERANEEYLRAIEPMGTDWRKPHLTDAPYLIAVFHEVWGLDERGAKQKHYRVRESVAIAVGFLLSSLQAAGVASLVYAPSPMRFLNRILRRPENERPFLLVAVGYPAAGARVPALPRKAASEIVAFV